MSSFEISVKITVLLTCTVRKWPWSSHSPCPTIFRSQSNFPKENEVSIVNESSGRFIDLCAVFISGQGFPFAGEGENGTFKIGEFCFDDVYLLMKPRITCFFFV